MKRLLAIATAAMLLNSCAMIKGGKMPNAADMAAMKDKMTKAQAAADAAVKKCPSADGNIPFEEEKQIGGAIMVGMAQENGSFLLEPEPDQVLPELKTKPSDVIVKKGPKNDVNAYVGKVGRLLASYSSRPELPWVFGVIENDSINAFSAPGGYVVITTGLMRLAENEAQLAAILGHEIGHVVNKDVVKSYASVKHTICVPAVTAAAYIQYGVGDSLPQSVRSQADFAKEFDKPGLDPSSGGFIDALTNGVLSLRKTFGAGKDAEFAADKMGFELMMFAGYDTNEFDKVIRKAEQGGKSFNNHPGNVDRLKAFTMLRNGKPAEGSDAADEYYKDFNTGGAAPAIPAEVKAAVPPEATPAK